MGCFLLIVLPWFIFNYSQYHSVFGFLADAGKNAGRWGNQPFWFYFLVIMKSFFVLIPFFILGLFKNERRKQLAFLIFWFLIVLLSASFMGHKEDRYIMPILPAFCIISALGISKLRKYSTFAFILVTFVLAGLSLPLFNAANSEEQKCFFSTMSFLKNSNALYVVTEHFSPVYYYSGKPNIRVNNYTEIAGLLSTEHKNQVIYYYYVNGDWFSLVSENPAIRDKLVYNCGNFNVFDLSFE